MNLPVLKQRLISKHVNVPDDWLAECVNFLMQQTPGLDVNRTVNEVYEYWLGTDLRELQVSSLPQINGNGVTFLNGVYVVQVISCIDIGSSFYSQHQKLTNTVNENATVTAAVNEELPPWEAKPKRCLWLELTDGTRSLKGLEFQPLKQSTENLLPGAKLVLKGRTKVRKGVALLTPANITLLGGNVPDLMHQYSSANIIAQKISTAPTVNNNTNDQNINPPQVAMAPPGVGVGASVPPPAYAPRRIYPAPQRNKPRDAAPRGVTPTAPPRPSGPMNCPPSTSTYIQSSTHTKAPHSVNPSKGMNFTPLAQSTQNMSATATSASDNTNTYVSDRGQDFILDDLGEDFDMEHIDNSASGFESVALNWESEPPPTKKRLEDEYPQEVDELDNIYIDYDVQHQPAQIEEQDNSLTASDFDLECEENERISYSPTVSVDSDNAKPFTFHLSPPPSQASSSFPSKLVLPPPSPIQDACLKQAMEIWNLLPQSVCGKKRIKGDIIDLVKPLSNNKGTHWSLLAQVDDGTERVTLPLEDKLITKLIGLTAYEAEGVRKSKDPVAARSATDKLGGFEALIKKPGLVMIVQFPDTTQKDPTIIDMYSEE